MALLCSPMENLAPPLAELMDPALQKQVTAKVNKAILEVQGIPKEAKIRHLVRLRAWAEQRIRRERREMSNMDLGLYVVSQTSDDGMGALSSQFNNVMRWERKYWVTAGAPFLFLLCFMESRVIYHGLFSFSQVGIGVGSAFSAGAIVNMLA